MADNIFDFIGGNSGQWKVRKMNTIVGDSLQQVLRLKIIQSSATKETDEGIWTLKGLTSNLRYTERKEKERLTTLQANLERQEATYAALIPIRKSEVWWTLAQDERREIFEKQSHHTETGLKYLPAIARKLYHCRDIGEQFDFLTWFEYAPAHLNAFEELVTHLRTTEEWKYVDREIDIRLIKV